MLKLFEIGWNKRLLNQAWKKLVKLASSLNVNSLLDSEYKRKHFAYCKVFFSMRTGGAQLG